MSGKFRHRIASNTLIFSLEGYIEKTVSEILVKDFKKHWRNGIRHVLFDFTKVTMINSVALGDILEIVSEGIGESDSGFYICAIPEKCHWGLSAIGLLNYMTEYDSLEQAGKELGLSLA